MTDTPHQAPAATMVIFGAAGDLTKRLVVPALYNLVLAGRLPDGFRVLGVDLADTSTDAWRQTLTATMDGFAADGQGEFHPDHIDQRAWDWLTGRMTYVQGDFGQTATFDRIRQALGEAANVLFYLAVADRFFGSVVEALGQAGLTKPDAGGWRRVIIEKPFGHDLASALALDAQVRAVLTEDQIYRIDHFLGKEAVQNILVLRFANGMFEPLWNREHIDHIQITAAEIVGVEQRGAFYEKTGALRDMVPNHLFQLLSMLAMEPPSSFGPEAVRSRKTELFDAITPIRPDDAVRGQYDAGSVQGKPVRAYRAEPHVAPTSNTETFAALKLNIENWRWAGVPFYLRTGKYLSGYSTEVVVHFRPAPIALFRGTTVAHLPPNTLTIRMQPDEGMDIGFSVKRPGPDIAITAAAMDFAYQDLFGPSSAVGYETLIYDCMLGDPTLFQRGDTVEAAWRAVQPVLDAWAAAPPADFPNYVAGSAGPAAADALLARDGRTWAPIARAPKG